jgi:quercetin dioxygenase-like cupin family protein
VQQEGGEKQVIKPGDVVWTPPGVKHWHGATASTAVTHIAILEFLNARMSDGWKRKQP